MQRYLRTLAACLTLIAALTGSTAVAVQEFRIDTGGVYTSYRFVSEVSGDNGHNTRLQLRPVQVLNEAQEGGDNGHYILAYNSLLTNDDPAIFGWRGYPVHEVEDDPVRLTVNDWRLYNDAKRGSRLIASAGYRSDSAWAFWLDPLTDETDYVYLCSGSDATGDGVWHPLLLLVLVADYDFDGKTEAFVYVSSGRDLVPRELFCVEMETLTVEWSLPVASLLNESNFLSCGDSANPAVIFTTYNVKQGISDTAFSDMHGDVAVVDASGHILTHRVVTTKHGGNQIRAHLRPGEYLLSHEIEPVAPELYAGEEGQGYSLSVIDRDCNILRTVSVESRVEEIWYLPYGEDEAPHAFVRGADRCVSIFDSDLHLVARSGPICLGKYLGSCRIVGRDDSVYVFNDGIYSRSFARLLAFATSASLWQPLARDSSGAVSACMVGGSNRYAIGQISPTSLAERAALLYHRYRVHTVLGISVLAGMLAVAMVMLWRVYRRVQISEARFREFADLLPQSVYEVDTNLMVTFTNSTSLERFGYTPKDLADGIRITEFVDQDDHPRALETIERVLAGESVVGETLTAVTRHGQRFPISVYADPVIRGGATVGFLGIAIDITAIKAATDRARKHEKRWRTLIKHIPDVLCTIDREGMIQTLNRAIDETSVKDRIGQCIYDSLADEFVDEVRTVITSVFDTCRPDHYRARGRAPDGSFDAWYEVRVVPMQQDGTVASALLIVSDVTDRVAAETALARRLNYETCIAECTQLLLRDQDGKDSAVTTVLQRLIVTTVMDSACVRENVAYDERRAVGEGDRSQLVVVVATTRAGETADVSWDDDDLIGWRESLARGRAVVGSVRTFPSVEQEHLRSHGIGSIVAVPIVIRDRWFGYLRLVSSDEERQWDDEDVRLLKTMAEVIGLHIERNRARAAVLDSEQRYSTLVETAPDGIAAICEETRLFLFANSGMCGLTGYESPELLRLSLDQLISCEAREEPLTLLWRRDEREQYNLANVPMVRKTGEVIYVNIRGVKGTISGVPAIIGFFRDVTEILQKERMLQQQKQNLKELTNHVIQLQEHDRRYVARELHDGVGQLLSLTRLHLERALLQHNGGGRNSLLQASETITAAADDLRRIATRMRPEMLDHLGLIPTMEWYLRTFTSGIESTLEVHGTARQLETNCETNLFRVFQELLANVHRHSRAKRVSVTVTFEDNAVRMVVRDDGIGFSVDGVKRRRSLHSSFGLLNMTERIDLLRGKLDIESGSGIGTTVTISVPNV